MGVAPDLQLGTAPCICEESVNVEKAREKNVIGEEAREKNVTGEKRGKRM